MLTTKRVVMLASVGAALAALPSVTLGQSGLTIWAGLGGASQEGSMTFGKATKQLGAQLGLPVIPVALRADAMMFGSGFDREAISYNVNGVVQMRLPVVQPYALIGRGRYAISPTEKQEGWNVGAGVRAGLGRFGVFGEVRRHDAIGRTVTLLGLTF